MKATITLADFLPKLAIASQITASSKVAILSNVLLSTYGDKLKLSASNGIQSITAICGAKVEQSGSFTVPAKLLHNLLPKKGVVSLEYEPSQYDHGRLVVKTDKLTSTLKGLPADRFPLLPDISPDLEIENVWELLKRVSKFTGDKFTGVFIENGRCFATDGFRIFESKFPLHNKIVIPGDFFSLSIKDNSKMGVKVGYSNLALFLGDITISTQLLKEQPPDYQSFLPVNEMEVRINRKELLEIIGSVLPISNVCHLVFEDNLLRVVAKDIEFGEGEAELSVEGSINDEVRVNGQHIVEGLSCFTEDVVSLKIGDNGESKLLYFYTDKERYLETGMLL